MIRLSQAAKPPIVKAKRLALADVQRKKYLQTCDTFERTSAVKTVAKDFRQKIMDPFADWGKQFPRKNDEGYSVIRQSINATTNFIDELTQQDAEQFTKLVFGENQVLAIEEASKRNSDVKLLKDHLEEHLGTTIRKAIHVD